MRIAVVNKGRLLFVIWVVALIWLLVAVMPVIINTIALGDMSLNAGGWLYDDDGSIIGLWDGHIGDTTLNPLQILGIIYKSLIYAPIVPLLVYSVLTLYWLFTRIYLRGVKL